MSKALELENPHGIHGTVDHLHLSEVEWRRKRSHAKEETWEVITKQWYNMGVSKNRGTPKSSISIGFSIINHPFWGTIIFGNTHIISYNYIAKISSLQQPFFYPLIRSVFICMLKYRWIPTASPVTSDMQCFWGPLHRCGSSRCTSKTMAQQSTRCTPSSLMKWLVTQQQQQQQKKKQHTKNRPTETTRYDIICHDNLECHCPQRLVSLYECHGTFGSIFSPSCQLYHFTRSFASCIH